MSKAIKTIRRFNQHYKVFNFSEDFPASEEEFLESVTELDAGGLVTSESKFDVAGQLEEKNSYSYESHGKVIEHVLLYAAEDMTERRIMNRDEKGRLLEEIKYYGDDSGERVTYLYDEKDNLVERKHFDEEADLQSDETFRYDEKGRLLELKKTGKEGQLEEHRAFLHGDNNTIIENEYKPDGSLVSSTQYTLDETGKELTAIQTTPDGKLISSVETDYDEKGNVLEKRFKDFYSKTIRYAYDEHSRCISHELFDLNGMLLRKNLFEYDEHGNPAGEQTYEMDTSRGGRDKHFGTRYEYEFW